MGRYGQFCPVSKAAEVLCERWMPLVIREILNGSERFTEIHRGVPGISPALLSKRLRQLEAAGIVERFTGDGFPTYRPTAAGRELDGVIEAMGVWAQRWVRSDYSVEELDPGFLMWDMRRRLNPVGLCESRAVVEFRFIDAPVGKSRFWLIVDVEIDLCLVDPRLEPDLIVSADVRALTEVWMGDTGATDAIQEGRMKIAGSSSLQRRFPEWLGSHPVFGHVEPERQRADSVATGPATA